jgi:hypothetical protein
VLPTILAEGTAIGLDTGAADVAGTEDTGAAPAELAPPAAEEPVPGILTSTPAAEQADLA